MEINDAMQARMTLLKETGYNVEAAKKCWDFVRGGDEAKKREPASGRLADGVYIIDCKGNAYDSTKATSAGRVRPVSAFLPLTRKILNQWNFNSTQ